MCTVEVKTEQGILKGKECQDFMGGTFYSFQGIPYAKPPVDALRFKDPQPWEPWIGTRDATQEKPGCYSIDFFTGNISGDEDCLYINVYTPEITTNPSRLKPIMVFVHAGAFIAGSGSTQLYGPEYLVSQDIVLVTLNYRVGALGFLSLEPDVPGNAGLMDQLMALNWVRQNITCLGGDHSNTTLFGHSAGAASVHYLLLSPKSKGLFHKVIIQSGTALDPWARGQELNGIKLCKALGVDPENSESALKALQEVPVNDILTAQLSIKDRFVPNFLRPFGPIIQKPHISQAILSEDPLNIILEGKYDKNIPIMFGYTSREGILFDFMYKESKQCDLETAIPHFLNLEDGSSLSMKIADKIKEFYFGDNNPTIGGDRLYQLQTDNLFFRGIYKSAMYHAEVNEKPVYLYRFSMESELNTMKLLFKKDNIGACHGDDIFYLFKNRIFPCEVQKDSKEFDGVAKMVQLWSNFAKYGSPNGQNMDIEWKPITKQTINFLDIDFVLEYGTNPEKRRMEFWDAIFQMKSCSQKY